MAQLDYSSYFDPEEIRRRRMLAPTAEMGGPEQENPFAAQVFAPDDEEDQAAEGPIKPRQHPALERFKQVIGQQPDAANYKPSKLRRFAAALSGFGAGMRDPVKGVDVAQGIISAPYQHAMAGWQNTLKGAQMGVTAEEKQEASDIAQQRAQSYQLSAQARMQAAQATEAWRRAQEANAPYQPHTLEEAIQLKKAGQRPTGYQPQTKEEYLQVHPPRDFSAEEQARLRNAREVAGIHEAGAMARTKYRAEHPTTRQQTAPKPTDVEHAEQLALDELLRQDPSNAAFVHKAVVNDKTGKVVQPHRVKSADELPRAGGGFLGIGGTSEAQASLARDQYNQFLVKLEKKKREILGRSGSAEPDWQIEPDDDEDDK